MLHRSRPRSLDRQHVPGKRSFLHRCLQAPKNLRESMRKAMMDIVNQPRNGEHPLGEILRSAEALENGVMQARRGLAKVLLGNTSKQRTPLNRSSATTVQTLFFLACISGIHAEMARALQPVGHPQVSSKAGFIPASLSKSPLPSPDAHIDVIMETLETTEAVEEFLQKHTQYQRVNFPEGFLRTFRRSPEDFLKARGGPCNNYGEFVRQWAERKDIRTYVMVMCPTYLPPETSLLEIIEKMCKEEWHEITVICMSRGTEYLIFDNDTRTHWQGPLEAYAQEYYPDKQVYQTVPWKPCNETFPSKMAMYLQYSIDENGMHEYPFVDVPKKKPPEGPADAEGFPWLQLAAIPHLHLQSLQDE